MIDREVGGGKVSSVRFVGEKKENTEHIKRLLLVNCESFLINFNLNKNLQYFICLKSKFHGILVFFLNSTYEFLIKKIFSVCHGIRLCNKKKSVCHGFFREKKLLQTVI